MISDLTISWEESWRVFGSCEQIIFLLYKVSKLFGLLLFLWEIVVWGMHFSMTLLKLSQEALTSFLTMILSRLISRSNSLAKLKLANVYLQTVLGKEFPSWDTGEQLTITNSQTEEPSSGMIEQDLKLSGILYPEWWKACVHFVRVSLGAHEYT